MANQEELKKAIFSYIEENPEVKTLGYQVGKKYVTVEIKSLNLMRKNK